VKNVYLKELKKKPAYAGVFVIRGGFMVAAKSSQNSAIICINSRILLFLVAFIVWSKAAIIAAKKNAHKYNEKSKNKHLSSQVNAGRWRNLFHWPENLKNQR
jgi:hypothetical protein